MKRSPSIISLVLITMIASTGNVLRFLMAISLWKTLEDYSVNTLYLAINSGIWLLFGLITSWGLWNGKTWAWYSALLGAGGYGAWYWFDRLVLQKPHSNLAFSLVATVVFILLISMLLFSRSTIRFFHIKSLFRINSTQQNRQG